jgi:hypothetical protein
VSDGIRAKPSPRAHHDSNSADSSDLLADIAAAALGYDGRWHGGDAGGTQTIIDE